LWISQKSQVLNAGKDVEVIAKGLSDNENEEEIQKHRSLRAAACPCTGNQRPPFTDCCAALQENRTETRFARQSTAKKSRNLL
jgi:hypothetical protein